MKTKSKGFFFKMDERNKLTALQVIAVLYFITIIALQAVVIYRQFALGQNIHDFEDFAIIMTFNSLFLVSALLYYGAIPIQKMKLKTMLLFYLAFVILGSLFTYLKYNVFQGSPLSFPELMNKLFIIFAITGLILLFFILFYFLGKRREDRLLGE
jgi:hypothetical protein